MSFIGIREYRRINIFGRMPYLELSLWEKENIKLRSIITAVAKPSESEDAHLYSLAQRRVPSHLYRQSSICDKAEITLTLPIVDMSGKHGK